MSWIWRYLTSPGQSLASYVLRLAPMLMASCLIVPIVMFSPGLVSGAARIQWSLKPEALFQTQAVVLIAVLVAVAAFASLMSGALVLALRRRLRDRFQIALLIGVLAAGLVGAFLYSIRAFPAASISLGLVFGWVFFVAAIATQVGQLTSNMHGLAASFLLLASTVIFSIAMAVSFTVAATPCEERHTMSERARCILREEHLRAMQESWKKLDFAAPPIDPEALTDQQLLSSIGPWTERMLRLGMAECDAQPVGERQACRTAFLKTQKWAPLVMTHRAQTMLREQKSRDRGQRD